MPKKTLKYLRCSKCGHQRYLNPEALSRCEAAAGRPIRVEEDLAPIRSRLRCVKCGRRSTLRLRVRVVPSRGKSNRHSGGSGGGASIPNSPRRPSSPESTMRRDAQQTERPRCAKCGRVKDTLHKDKPYCRTCLVEKENDLRRLGRPRPTTCPRCGRRRCRC